MSFDNSKYHVELNGVPYQVSGYQKSEVSTFIPRLGSGDQNEYEFDLLKSRTIQGFEGGTLQRYLKDNTSVFASERLYPIYDDGTLYPTAAPIATQNILGTSKAAMTAYCRTYDYLFVAYRTYNGSTNYIKRIDLSGTVTSLTLPASLSSSPYGISSMVINNGQLWIFCPYISSAIWYMPLSTTTVTAITGGSGYLSRAVVYRGAIYGTGGQDTNRILYKYTGSTTTRAFEQVGNTGTSDNDYTASLFVYNSRIILTRHDGMWAYDGIQMNAIEDARDSVDSNNYRFPTVLKGYLYYFMPDGMYRFNGSLIEKLYDISEIGMPVDAFTGKNRIWLLYKNSDVTPSRYDKSMGYDYSVGDSVDGRIMVFNGKALYTYGRTTTFTKSGTDDFDDQGALLNGCWFNDTLYAFTNYEKLTGAEYFTVDTNEKTLTGNKIWRLVTSIDDSEFPMIDKSLENIEITLDGYVSSNQTITIEYRTGGFDGSTGWTTLGTVSTQTNLQEYVFENTPAGISYKQIQFRLSGTTAAGYGIKQIVVRYLLVPDYKNQWTMTFLCYGDDKFSPLLLADNTESTQAVDTLRSNIYTARNSNVPVKFIDIDALDLAEDLTNSETLVDITGIELLKGDSGFFQIDDEIFYWTSKTSTTATTVRGALGTSATTHTTGAKVYPLYRVIVRQIQNERVELTDPSPETVSDKTRPSEITLTLQEV